MSVSCRHEYGIRGVGICKTGIADVGTQDAFFGRSMEHGGRYLQHWYRDVYTSICVSTDQSQPRYVFI
jgi:hypothetical protein